MEQGCDIGTAWDRYNAETGVCLHALGGRLDELKVIEVAIGDKNILTKAVEIAEFFLDSDGTAFEPAQKKAAETVASQAYQKADVVFITEGQASTCSEVSRWFSWSEEEAGVQGIWCADPISRYLDPEELRDEIIQVYELIDAEAEQLLEIWMISIFNVIAMTSQRVSIRAGTTL